MKRITNHPLLGYLDLLGKAHRKLAGFVRKGFDHFQHDPDFALREAEEDSVESGIAGPDSQRPGGQRTPVPGRVGAHGIRRRIDSLTPREREILDWVVSGTPNKRIAAELGISIKTVEAHRARVMAAKSVAELTALRVTYRLR